MKSLNYNGVELQGQSSLSQAESGLAGSAARSDYLSPAFSYDCVEMF